MQSHVLILSYLCPNFFLSFYTFQEGAELAEGDGQEVDQGSHEEAAYDQQEEQDEY